ncbi:hypothetical protein [Nonomuraea harbinensis]|uniref:ATP-binding protein n=1 Tax=Nonomuraea harbinensis TaxID=1286938 RepID=A0ABW1C8S7_9ACTN|nr:hypothetical protein [Nonomuraea harbinensis]
MSETMAPFKADEPVSPEHTIGRDEEGGMIRVWARGGRLMVLIAPRHFGKTSLIGKVAAEGKRDGLAVISANLFEVASLADLVLRIERAWGSHMPGVRSSVQKALASASRRPGGNGGSLIRWPCGSETTTGRAHEHA